VEVTRHVFAYVFAGGGKFCNASEPLEVPTEPVGWLETAPPPSEADNRSLVLFDRGDELMVQAGEEGIRFLLVSGKPLEEPVAWYGPIVMNTQEQLREAFWELQEGTFLKARGKHGWGRVGAVPARGNRSFLQGLKPAELRTRLPWEPTPQEGASDDPRRPSLQAPKNKQNFPARLGLALFVGSATASRKENLSGDDRVHDKRGAQKPPGRMA